MHRCCPLMAAPLHFTHNAQELTQQRLPSWGPALHQALVQLLRLDLSLLLEGMRVPIWSSVAEILCGGPRTKSSSEASSGESSQNRRHTSQTLVSKAPLSTSPRQLKIREDPNRFWGSVLGEGAQDGANPRPRCQQKRASSLGCQMWSALVIRSTKALETDLWGPPAYQPSSSYGLSRWQGWGFTLLPSLQPSREELAVCAGHILHCTRTSGH